MNKTTRFYGNGGSFKVGDGYDYVAETLPTGVYTPVQDPHGNWWCSPYGGIEVPRKIYGELSAKYASMCINAFDFRDRSTGFLLSGISGSGKTLTAKMIAHKMMTERGYPVFLIDRDTPGQALGDIFGKIKQPIVVIFEEIEKNYDEDDKAESLLTLLDGVIPGKRLTIATCNEPNKLPKWFKNRPSRFYYHIKYDGFEQRAVSDLLAECDTLSPERKRAVEFFARSADMAFDAVAGIVAELQCYDTTLEEAMSRLNIEIAGIGGEESRHHDFYAFDDDWTRIGEGWGEMDDDFNIKIRGESAGYPYMPVSDEAKDPVKVCDLTREGGGEKAPVFIGDSLTVYPLWEHFKEVYTKNDGLYMRGRVSAILNSNGRERTRVKVNIGFKLRSQNANPILHVARAADAFAKG